MTKMVCCICNGGCCHLPEYQHSYCPQHGQWKFETSQDSGMRLYSPAGLSPNKDFVVIQCDSDGFVKLSAQQIEMVAELVAAKLLLLGNRS